MDPKWLDWAKKLQAIAQTGLEYANNEFDRERYLAIRQIAIEMASEQSGVPSNVVEGLFCTDGGYATPKVDVRAAVICDGKILMVKERSDGLWTLPGGWADVGDSPASAVEREVREETGYEVRAAKLAAVYDRNRHGHPPMIFHAWKLFFLCELLGGTARESHETEAVGFFDESALPPLSVGRVTAAQIAHMFEHSRHPQWSTSFD